MAGKKGRSGRRKRPGQLYRLYIRYRPGLDPPEIEKLLETLVQAAPQRRADIFRAAVADGLDQANVIAQAIETNETTSLLDDLFATF